MRHRLLRRGGLARPHSRNADELTRFYAPRLAVLALTSQGQAWGRTADDGHGFDGGLVLFEGERAVRADERFGPAQTAKLGNALHQRHRRGTGRGPVDRHRLPRATRVELAINSVAGQRVRVLLDDLRPAGAQSVDWDGTDAAGRPVACGVYLCRLRTTQGQRTLPLLRLH